MHINANYREKTHSTHKTRILFILLTVVLISSLPPLFVWVFMANSNDSSPYDTLHVKNERELIKAINKATNPTTIKLDNDVGLANTLVISANKEITITSNTDNADDTGFFKLVGATDKTTITIENGAVLHLVGITVTHKISYIYGNYIEHENGLGVEIADGGKLFMVTGEISGNNGWGDRYGYGGGVRVYNGGFFEMTGGVIADNGGARFGGGVGVLGVFIMSGNAVIANNYASHDGRGVYVAYNGTFILPIMQ